MFSARTIALAAVAPLVLAALWVGRAYREASAALDAGAVAADEAARVPSERVAWVNRAAAFEPIPSIPAFNDAAVFDGAVYLSAPTGIYRFSSTGAFERSWLCGRDFPPAAPTSLAVGLDPQNGERRLWIATAGGAAVLDAAGAAQFLRPLDERRREFTAVLPLATGRVLFGTRRDGILVYDGRELAQLRAEFAGLKVTALEGDERELWIGTLDQGLVRWTAGRIERFSEADGLPDQRILSLAAEGNALYAGTPVGAVEFRDGARRRSFAEGLFVAALAIDGETLHAGSPEEGVAAIRRKAVRPIGPGAAPSGPRGVVQLRRLGRDLFAVAPDALFKLPGGERSLTDARPGRLTARNVSALRVDRAGRLWVGYFDRGLDLVDLESENPARHVEDDTVFCVNRVVEDVERDRVAVASANGLALFDSAGRLKEVLRREDGLIADHVTDVVTRSDGLTVATPAGITFLEGGPPRSLYALHGLVNNHVYALAARGSTLLAGTLGGLSVLSGSTVRANHTATNSKLAHHWIAAIVDFGGEWFIGTYGAGVMKLDDAGRWTAFPDMSGVEINPNAMTTSPTRVYAGALDGGLLVHDPSRERWSRVVDGLPSVNVTALDFADGMLYVGTDNGVTRVAEERLTLP